MNPERLQDLWARFLDGHALAEDEERELLDALQSDESLRHAFLQEARIDGRLRALSRSRGDEDSFARRFQDCLAAGRDESRFIRKMQESLKSGKPPARRSTRRRALGETGTRSRFFLPALVAAGLLFAFLVLLTIGAPTTPPVSAPHVPGARLPEDREPEKSVVMPRRPPVAPIDPQRPAPEPETIPRPAPSPASPDRARKIEEQMRKAIDRDRPKRIESTPKPRVPDAAPPTIATSVAAGILESLRGHVDVVEASGRRKPASQGLTLSSGQGLATGAGGSVTLRFADGTTITLEANTVLRSVSDREPRGPGKRVFMDSGTLRADVAKQPLTQQMVFTTPTGEARVLGTTLRLIVDSTRTRLDVTGGKVRLKRRADGKSVDVVSGYFAVAAEGTPLKSRIVPVDDIVLRAGQATFFGKEWKRVKDPAAFSGEVLEARTTQSAVRAPVSLVRMTRSHAGYSFFAERGKIYHVWIRGRCLATEGEPTHQDAAVVEFPGAVVTPPPGPNNILAGSPNRALFNGWGRRAGYGWIGGDADFGRDIAPATVRFLRDGPQRMNVYPLEVPIRIDAIWLSTTQEDRPDAAESGPRRMK